MNTVEMTGKTPEEAIEFALKELDAERGEVEIDVVNRGKSGILGIGGEPARVRVTLIEQPSDLARVATEVLEDLIERMDVVASVHLKQAYNEEVDGPIIEVDGEDSGLLIGRRGETLRSLQFIVSFICAKRMGERVNLFVDVAGYQERRYNSLRNLAKRVAQRVADGGRLNHPRTHAAQRTSHRPPDARQRPERHHSKRRTRRPAPGRRRAAGVNAPCDFLNLTPSGGEIQRGGTEEHPGDRRSTERVG